MKKIRLGVNIDHVATLRNARNEGYPNLIDVAKILKKIRVDSITVHLREDRRHIKDEDVEALKKENLLPLNLEMAATKEMKEICIKTLPEFCCIVPERREELTTEGGLDVKNQMMYLSKFIPDLINCNIKVSLFVDPDFEQIKASKELGVNSVELHTGKFARLYNEKQSDKELERIKKASQLCRELGLGCHAGHGLNYKSAKILSSLKGIKEFNIGHFLIGESIFVGLAKTIKNFKKIVRK